MLATIEPGASIRSANAVDAGHHAVYTLTVDTDAGEREWYLKATPSEKLASVNREARLLAILEKHTEIPVPAVRGVVDEHETLPAPYLVVEAMPGTTHPRTMLPSISDDELEGIARETGRHLAAVHQVPAVDGCGFLTPAGPTLHGGRPSGALDTIRVADPATDWQACVQDWTDDTLEQLASTRFADLAPDASQELTSQIGAIQEHGEPALARIDQALENLLLQDGTLSAMLDWEFTIAATPAYDIVHVAWSLAGGPYLYAPSVADRWDRVFAAVLDGYAETGDEQIVALTRTNRECYELLTVIRSMTLLEDWFELFDLGNEIDGAADILRADVRERL